LLGLWRNIEDDRKTFADHYKHGNNVDYQVFKDDFKGIPGIFRQESRKVTEKKP
jgi:hypothetical protein